MKKTPKWKEKLNLLKIGIREAISIDDKLEGKLKKEMGRASVSHIRKLLKLIDECLGQPSISDNDIMDILNTIVVITQTTASHALINLLQSRVDYLWELHFELMKKKA